MSTKVERLLEWNGINPAGITVGKVYETYDDKYLSRSFTDDDGDEREYLLGKWEEVGEKEHPPCQEKVLLEWLGDDNGITLGKVYKLFPLDGEIVFRDDNGYDRSSHIGKWGEEVMLKRDSNQDQEMCDEVEEKVLREWFASKEGITIGKTYKTFPLYGFMYFTDDEGYARRCDDGSWSNLSQETEEMISEVLNEFNFDAVKKVTSTILPHRDKPFMEMLMCARNLLEKAVENEGVWCESGGFKAIYLEGDILKLEWVMCSEELCLE